MNYKLKLICDVNTKWNAESVILVTNEQCTKQNWGEKKNVQKNIGGDELNMITLKFIDLICEQKHN